MPPGRAESAAKQSSGPKTISDHSIRPADIHPNVHFVCQRLREHGHTALLVGGAVRDLLLRRSPKDFDLATSARPEAVKQLFRNARIIGRRFKLVQLRYPNMAMEVATFRGEPRDKRQGMIRRDNRYGTSEEDARRRDFTVNALTFDPLTMTLYDYVGGLDDLKRKRIRTIKPPEDSFREDPVRMMRAVRFKVRLGFDIDPECEQTIRRLSGLLGDVKRHRMAEEIQRFLTRGNAVDAYAEFDRLGLLKPMLDLRAHEWFFAPEARKAALVPMQPYLRRMDAWIQAGGEPIAPTVALLGLLITLARPEFQAFVLAAEQAGGRGRGKASGKAPQSDPRLPAFLAEWGMLNGQVLPALSILDAHRALMQSDARILDDPKAVAGLPGVREAVLLSAIVREVLNVPEERVERALTHLPQLPDLPILDHPRPAQRARILHEGEQGEGRRPRSRRRRPRPAGGRPPGPPR